MAFLVGLVAVGLFTLTLTDREPPIRLKPVDLVASAEKGGIRCPKRHWDDLSENPVCYRLQERLTQAVVDGNVDLVVESLRMGAHVDGSYYQSYKPLHTAGISGHVLVVKTLIENGADVNSYDGWMTSPLQVAVYYEQYSIAKLLLENGANVCHIASWDDLSTPTALGIATKKQDLAMTNLLMSYGAGTCATQ